MISDLRALLFSSIGQLSKERFKVTEKIGKEKKVEIKKWTVRLVVRGLEIMMGLDWVRPESSLTV